ncbi:predicted protein [Postia placenta Mad-698-R]|nr:predicted protein [Postia placenta Mad-698-R]
MNRPPPPPPALLQTPGFAHYSLAWSPFHSTRLALASAANYGLVGNGRLHLVSLGPGPGGVPGLSIDKCSYDTQDGLYDVAWSEVHENQLVTASGDGSIRLWDIMLNDLPLRAWQEHTREVFSLDWSNLQKDLFVSASWDGTVKLVLVPRAPALAQHAARAPRVRLPGALLAAPARYHRDVPTDGTLKIFDLRAPAYAAPAPGGAPGSFTAPLSAAALTVLTLDWNKYRPWVLASAGVDKAVKVWDCRMVKMGAGAGTGAEQQAVGGLCETHMAGHEYAVRRVQWSPHRPDVLATASYDMTCRVWTTTPTAAGTHLLYIHDPHTEFVVGCGWSLYDDGLLASCGWDSRLNVFRV